MDDDYEVYDTIEAWTLDMADRLVYHDGEEVHHIEVYVVDDEETHFTGDGHCFDHDEDCHFEFSAFEEVDLWTFTQ